MGVSATFQLLAGLPLDQRLPLVEAALREPYPELQTAAFDALADPLGLNRPDLIIQHYPELLPPVRARIAEHRVVLEAAAREELRSGSEISRRAAYEVLASIGPLNAAAVLVRGVNDPSTLVRESVAGALETLALRYYYHLVTWRMHGDAQSRQFVEENKGTILQAMGDLLRTWASHEKRVFLDIAIESGEETYAMITDIVVARRDQPVYRAFLQVLSATVTESAVELLFKLFLDQRPRLREVALEVMKLRRDPAFPGLLAAWLSRLPQDRFEALAARVKEVPWWPAVEAAPSLDPIACAKIMEFLARSGLDAAQRNALIYSFHRSPHAEVRARVLTTLEAGRSPLLLDAAVGFLEDPSDDVKIAAARTILALDPPNKEKYLLPLLSSANPDLRRMATQEVSEASFEKYMRSFDKLEPRTRELAAQALAKIDANIIGRLTEQITSLDPQRRLKALRIIDYVDAESELRGLLLELLSDPDRRVRATVIKIVQLSGSADGMRLLAGALSDPDHRVRANAIEAFEDSGDTRFVSLLMPFLNDRDNRTRANAAKALFRLGRPAEAKETLESMLRDPNENMRVSAVWAIGEVRYEGAAQQLVSRAREDASTRVRAKIAEILAKMAEPAPEGGVTIPARA